MNIKIDCHDADALARIISEIMDMMIVARLKGSLEDWAALTHPGDRKYYKEYNKAAKFVIAHFSGPE